jgi:hypothetical protein
MAQATQAVSARLAAQRAPGANPSTAIQASSAGSNAQAATAGQRTSAQVLAPAVQLAAATAWKVLPLRSAAFQKATAQKAAAPANPQLALDRRGELPTRTLVPLEVHQLPACAPVALAEHLAFMTGVRAPAADIAALHEQLGPVSIGDMLEAVAAGGFAGVTLAAWTRCDEDRPAPGLLAGIRLRAGYHAIVTLPGGMASWGMMLPPPGALAEAWHLQWAVPAGGCL